MQGNCPVAESTLFSFFYRGEWYQKSSNKSGQLTGLTENSSDVCVPISENRRLNSNAKWKMLKIYKI